MAKQPAPIKEVSRLLDLVPYLSTHSHISLKELSREFGVSEKEMANELTALSMCGLPGYTPYELIEVFFDSGFVTINNHEALDIPRALTTLEAASLLIGLEILRESHQEGSDEYSRVSELIDQIRQLIGSSIVVERGLDNSHQVDVEAAIAARETIEISYLSPSRDELTIRKVDPLSLENNHGFTYLIAYCHLSSEVRNFRLDRVHSVTRLAQKFESQAKSKASLDEKIVCTVEIGHSRRAIAELFSLDSLPASGLVEITTFSSEWLSRAVIAHSPDLTLAQPSELRQHIHQKLENILALYAP